MTVRGRSDNVRAQTGKVRISGGKWRGRKLSVASLPALRPTPQRVRETLFNWLAPVLDGARCLDLYAGTGALGLEAVSRGALGATLLDDDPLVAKCLREHVEMLVADSVEVIEKEALSWLLNTRAEPFDIVFLDPPFHRGLVEASLRELRRGWLKPHARVYLEAEKLPILQLEADGWQVTRQGRTRQVNFALVEIAETAKN